MVLRLQYRRQVQSEAQALKSRLEELGYAPDHVYAFRRMLSHPTGITVLAGKVGSGKTTTIMNLVEALYKERPERHYLTLEDPPEGDILGAVQTSLAEGQPGETRSETYAKAIRFMLRLDPDLLMIGEVRDSASIEAATQACITGLPILTTTHTNSAIDILKRFYALMGAAEGTKNLDPYTFFDSPNTIAGLVYQALVPALCKNCRVAVNADKSGSCEAVERIRAANPRVLRHSVYLRGPGCDLCQGTGYTGRRVLAETVAPDDLFFNLYRTKGFLEAKMHWLNELKGRPTAAHALERIARGEIDPSDAEHFVGWLDQPMKQEWWETYL